MAYTGVFVEGVACKRVSFVGEACKGASSVGEEVWACIEVSVEACTGVYVVVVVSWEAVLVCIGASLVVGLEVGHIPVALDLEE